MTRRSIFLLIVADLCVFASTSFAQYPVVTAQDVKTWMDGKRKIMLIDTRLPEEYRAGHIPGAVNIPAERMHVEAARLPKDKSTPIIFYCRGAG